VTTCSFVVKNVWEIYCVWEFHTYRKFADELYEVYKNIYIFLLLKWMMMHDDDIIIAATIRGRQNL